MSRHASVKYVLVNSKTMTAELFSLERSLKELVFIFEGKTTTGKYIMFTFLCLLEKNDCLMLFTIKVKNSYVRGLEI